LQWCAARRAWTVRLLLLHEKSSKTDEPQAAWQK
jgi:hypothetical protein